MAMFIVRVKKALSRALWNEFPSLQFTDEKDNVILAHFNQKSFRITIEDVTEKT